MKSLTAIVWIALSAAACSNPTPVNQTPGAANVDTKPAVAPADPHAAFPDLSVEDVAGLVAEKKCIAVDANGAETRSQYGVVPGAVLLSDYQNWKPGELPADKSAKLVFYCGSQKCTAAPKAAQLATQAGYKDVNVMRAGIKGWVAAGKQVDKPST